jgi:hypothetical protein
MKRSLLLISLLALAAILAASPYAWRSARLIYAKHSARKIFDGYSPKERANLNVTPKQIVLPHVDTSVDDVGSADLGDYIVRFPRAEKSAEPVANSSNRGTTHPAIARSAPVGIRLAYPRFSVIILVPHSTSTEDLNAQQLQFKDSFDMLSACYHARLDELDAQHDLPSLKRYLLLMSAKPARTACIEEFERGDLRGFILAPLVQCTVAEVSITGPHAGCGVLFYDQGGMTIDDVHQFLAVLRFTPK